MRTRILSALGPSGSSHHRTVSQEMIATPTSDTVYTFSLTTAWLHTVNAVAPIKAASAPPSTRCQRSASQLTSTRSVIRNQTPADTAAHVAASMFTQNAGFMPGMMEKTRPIKTKNGFPGGWGSPTTYAAAMYSLVSHIAVEGPSVMMY